MPAGIGMRGSAATLSSLGRVPFREMTWSRMSIRAVPIMFYSERASIVGAQTHIKGS